MHRAMAADEPPKLVVLGSIPRRCAKMKELKFKINDKVSFKFKSPTRPNTYMPVSSLGTIVDVQDEDSPGWTRWKVKWDSGGHAWYQPHQIEFVRRPSGLERAIKKAKEND
jgi:hypothetical protein